jgi:hypothetical protein
MYAHTHTHTHTHTIGDLKRLVPNAPSSSVTQEHQAIETQEHHAADTQPSTPAQNPEQFSPYTSLIPQRLESLIRDSQACHADLQFLNSK